jgi:hypothetical protein
VPNWEPAQVIPAVPPQVPSVLIWLPVSVALALALAGELTPMQT